MPEINVNRFFIYIYARTRVCTPLEFPLTHNLYIRFRLPATSYFLLKFSADQLCLLTILRWFHAQETYLNIWCQRHNSNRKIRFITIEKR
jgi:hypothetical protein